MGIKTLSFCAAVATVVLTGCVNNIEAQTSPVESTALFNQTKMLVAERMRDPEATRFKSEYAAYKTQQGDYVVCGTLNAKNAMGGYVGYKPFYARLRNNQLESFIIPSENDQYGMVLNQVKQVCADAAAGKIMISS